MTLDLDTARTLVDRADADALADLLIAASERARRAVADELQDRSVEPLRGAWRDLPQARFDTAQVAWFGTGLATDLRWSQFLLAGSGRTSPRLAAVIAARPAPVRGALARGLLAEDPHRYWPVVRTLRDTGAIDAPDAEVDLEAMVRWLTDAGYVDGAPGDPVATLVARLTADPTLVDPLYDALELEPVAERLAARAFGDGLVAAAVSGAVDRARLLEVALRGWVRDLRPGAAGGFRHLAVGLAPTPDELAPHRATLVRAVAGGHPAEQRLAARWLRDLIDAGQDVAGDAVANAVATPLGGRQKAAAIEALQLLAAVDVPPGARAHAAVVGLGHAHADVQGRSLDLLEATVAAEGALPVAVSADLLAWSDVVAPEHRSRVQALLGSGLPAAQDAEPAAGMGGDGDAGIAGLRARAEALPARVAVPLGLDDRVAAVAAGELPRPFSVDVADVPDRGAPLVPVADVDELVELLGLLLAGTGDALDLERAIDGLARTSPTQLTPGAAAALDRAQPWESHAWDVWSVQHVVLSAVHHWRRGVAPARPAHLDRARRRAGLAAELAAPRAVAAVDRWMVAFDGHGEPSGVLGFLSGRLWEATTTGVTAPRPTLAFPSTDRGWLTVDDLAARLVQRRGRPDRYDAVQALLRLHPGDVGGVPVGRRGDAVAAAVRRFLDPDAPQPDDEGLARAISRHPVFPGRIVAASVPHRDVHHGDIPVVRFDVEPPPRPRRRDDPVGELWEELLVPTRPIDVDDWWSPHASSLPPAEPLATAWSTLALPRHRDLVTARAVPLLAEELDQNRSSDGLDRVVADLLDPDRALGRVAHLLLAVGLTTRNEGVAAASVDVVAAASTEGRLDPVALGDALAELASVGVARPARVADRLGRIVDDGAVTAELLRRALPRWLGGLDELPRDVHAPLALLERACATSGNGIDDEAARDALERVGAGSSKRARSAARLLALPRRPTDGTVGAALLAAAIDRAERWAGEPG